MVSSCFHRDLTSASLNQSALETVLEKLPRLTYPTTILYLSPIELQSFSTAKELFLSRANFPASLKRELASV